MSIQALLRALSVPLFILTLTALYWWSIQDAASSAQRVPLVVIFFIMAMSAIVIIKEMIVIRLENKQQEDDFDLHLWAIHNGQRIYFVAISLGYFLLFIYLGFNIANVIFLTAALPLAGLGKERSIVTRIALSSAIAVVVAIVFHFLANIMDFNVPASPFNG